MDVGAPFVADGEPPKAVEPGQRALRHPAMAAEALGGLDAAAGKARDNAPLPASGPTAWVVVALVVSACSLCGRQRGRP